MTKYESVIERRQLGTKRIPLQQEQKISTERKPRFCEPQSLMENTIRISYIEIPYTHNDSKWFHITKAVVQSRSPTGTDVETDTHCFWNTSSSTVTNSMFEWKIEYKAYCGKNERTCKWKWSWSLKQSSRYDFIYSLLNCFICQSNAVPNDTSLNEAELSHLRVRLNPLRIPYPYPYGAKPPTEV